MKLWLAAWLALPLAANAADRFPQPVPVKALIGQKLIAPVEAQPLLGHIEAIERMPGGSLAARVRTWSLLPWRRRTVAVPLEEVSYLGLELALTGMTLPAFHALPPAPAAPSLPAGDIVRLGLTKPFH